MKKLTFIGLSFLLTSCVSQPTIKNVSKPVPIVNMHYHQGYNAVTGGTNHVYGL